MFKATLFHHCRFDQQLFVELGLLFFSRGCPGFVVKNRNAIGTGLVNPIRISGKGEV